MLSSQQLGTTIKPKQPTPPYSQLCRTYNQWKISKASLACTACRKRRCKCTGAYPCGACLRYQSDCDFANSTDRRRKPTQTNNSGIVRNQETCLSWLADNLRDEKNAHIGRALDQIKANTSLSAIKGIFMRDFLEESASSSITAKSEKNTSEVEPTFTNSFSSRRSIDSFGHIESSVTQLMEDPNRDISSRASGFISRNTITGDMNTLINPTHPSSMDGANSSLGITLKNDLPTLRDLFGHPFIPMMTYSTDSLNLEMSNTVNFPESPGSGILELLVSLYFGGVQQYLPLVDQSEFLVEYRSYCVPGNAHFPSIKWLTIINLVLAIGAQHGFLIMADPRIHSCMHSKYFTRARQLGLYDSLLFEHPDVEVIQVEGLTAFYLLSIGQINRAWRFSRQAMSSAITLGLHMNIPSCWVSEKSAYSRSLKWWSLCSLELILNLETGRDTWGTNFKSATRVPAPFNNNGFDPLYTGSKFCMRDSTGSTIGGQNVSLCTEDPPTHNFCSTRLAYEQQRTSLNNSYFFFHYLQLLMLSRNALEDLYQNTLEVSQRKSIMSNLWSMTETWLYKLPSEYNFIKSSNSEMAKESISLGCLFYSTRILITRTSIFIPPQDSSIRTYHFTELQLISRQCTTSAISLIEILPDKLDGWRLYESVTWWRALYYLMQAILVLLKILSLEYDTRSDLYEPSLIAAQKALSWIHELSRTNYSAQRAWVVCSDLFSQVMRGESLDTTGVLAPCMG